MWSKSGIYPQDCYSSRKGLDRILKVTSEGQEGLVGHGTNPPRGVTLNKSRILRANALHIQKFGLLYAYKQHPFNVLFKPSPVEKVQLSEMKESGGQI